MKSDQWRLIITPPSAGAWNMSVDEAILSTVIKGTSPPTLRMYSWSPFCLSLGHSQAVADVNTDFLKRAGWDLVRRPTGGRAILHADEMTYSVCAPIDDHHVHGGVIESYRKISACLLRALEMLGVHADSNLKNTEENHLSKDPVCFQYPSDYEITFSGKKIIGSAQARRANALLQHGAIPLSGDITRIISCLAFDTQEQREKSSKELRSRAGTLEEAGLPNVSWENLVQAMVSAFEEVFVLELIEADLSDEEQSLARELVQQKYDHPDWTNRV